MYVLVGSGALFAFCCSALQQGPSPPADPPPAFGFFIPESTGMGFTPESSGLSCSGAGGAATGAAEGRGGGGSSFLQPVTSTPARRSVSEAASPRVVRVIPRSVARPCGV